MKKAIGNRVKKGGHNISDTDSVVDKETAELGKDAKVQYLDVSIVLMAGDEEGTNTNPVVKPVTPSTESKAPQTGDSSSFMVYAVICLVALLAIVLVKKRNVLVKTRLPKK